jgi:nucleoside-diphosphate-sugar epimerase
MPRSVPWWWAKYEIYPQLLYGMLTDRPRRLTGIDVGNMTSRTRVSIAKAQRLLGYAPRYTLERGMAECEAWLREAGYLAKPRGAATV